MRLLIAASLLLAIPLTAQEPQREKIPGVDVIYDWVKTPQGFRVRTLVSHPQNATGKLPAVFLVGWLSCDGIDYAAGAMDGTAKTLMGIAKSGVVLVRTQKPGLGESEGPKCEELDFNTELAAYRASFQALSKYDFIDLNQVFLLGISNGGGFAPLVAEGSTIKPKGYVIAGGWVKTWYEHMLEIERRKFALSGKTPGEVNDLMRKTEQLYDLYLNQRMTPGAAIAAHPELAAAYDDQPDHQYGRPALFYQQLQVLNLAGAWEKVDAPVLAIHGQYDWIMSRADHEMIAEIVNQRHPGFGAFVEQPAMGHGLDVFPSAQASFHDRGGHFDEAIVRLMTDWLRAHI